MQNNYVYPAQFIDCEYGIAIQFKDFGIYVEEENMENLISSAQEQLALEIIDRLDRGEELPAASLNDKNALYVQIWLPYYRTKVKEVYVRKNVTIPAWLDILAKEQNINYSATLVKGLKEELGIN